jgi:leucyl-tRNA synthetase
MAIAADHPLAKEGGEGTTRLAAFIEEMPHGGTSAAEIETAEKKGFDTGICVVHPFDPNWTLPVYVANFVLMDYGTGAIFGCPSATSATSTSPTNTVCRSCRWSCRKAPMRDLPVVTDRPMSTTA